MRHEAGLMRFPKPIMPEWMNTENVKKNVMGEIVEKTKPIFAAGYEDQR